MFSINVLFLKISSDIALTFVTYGFTFHALKLMYVQYNFIWQTFLTTNPVKRI